MVAPVVLSPEMDSNKHRKAQDLDFLLEKKAQKPNNQYVPEEDGTRKPSRIC